MVLLTESGDLTLAELRTMAARQQHQIEAQQQLLVAKEQRLKFLKQQEARHHQGPHANDGERLRHLREKVEVQELKLRRLRALRGQVDQHRADNNNLTAELDSVRALFNEKEKELSVAVAKVEELTKQLEELKQGNLAGRKIANGATASTALELKKLRRELVYRANLTEQQNARIAQQQQTLAQRHDEISLMDQRIRELQQRLQRKRLHNQQLANHIQAVTLAKQSNSRVRNLTSNVAAVEPVKRVVQEPDRSHDDIVTKVNSTEGDFFPNKKDPKYQTLPYNTKFSVRKDLSSGGVRPEESKPIVQNGNAKAPSVTPVKPIPPQGLNNLAPRPYGTTYNSSLLVSHLPTSRNQNSSNKGTSQSVTTAVPKSSANTVASSEQRIKPPLQNQTTTRRAYPAAPPVGPSHRQPPPRLRQPPEPPPSHASPDHPDPKPMPSKSPTPSKPMPPPRQIHAQNSTDADCFRYNGRAQMAPPHPPRIQNHNKTQLKPSSPDAAESIENHPPDQNANIVDSSLRMKSGVTSTQNSSTVHGVHITLNRRIEMPPAFLFPEGQAPPADLNPAGSQDSEGHASNRVKRRPLTEDNLRTGDLDKSEPQGIRTDGDGGTGEKPDQSLEKPFERESHGGPAIRRAKKGNLKTKGSAKNIRRVSFDPLALLLDAALEGEVELVKKTAAEVTNPSAANDEGITALHNAICAGHFEIVKYLVEYGCDVNAQDSDGWTPLHCAASCNNLPMVKYLVEHGACIFATTLSDHETAAEKCEEDEEGFDGCSEYLYSIQEKLGILNGGAVYAVYEYDGQNPDELSFRDGDKMVVLRKGDEIEREWWWSRLRDREGYIPRNLLGLYPRINTRRES